MDARRWDAERIEFLLHSLPHCLEHGQGSVTRREAVGGREQVTIKIHCFFWQVEVRWADGLKVREGYVELLAENFEYLGRAVTLFDQRSFLDAIGAITQRVNCQLCVHTPF